VRILLVHNRHRVAGGEDVVVEQETELLRSHGHDVATYIVDNPTSTVETVATMVRAPWNPARASDVVRAARAHRADVVHVHNTWFSLSPALFRALSKARFPTVTTLHNFRTACINGLLLRSGQDCELCVGRGPWPGVRHRCYRGSATLSAVAAATVAAPRLFGVWERDVRRFLVLDEQAIPQLVASGIPADHISVRPNFVHDPGPRSRPPSASTEILYVGRLSAEKGIGVLVDAWCSAPPPGLELTVYGDGPLLDGLRARSLSNVRFAGRVPREELPTIMSGARALVFPSICREAGPLAPVEAMAAGLPCVASALVGYATTLSRAGAGWSVPHGQPLALAAALDALRDDKAIDQAGAAARILFERCHSPEAAIRSLEVAYEMAGSCL
jgi:glycosyltransferase involved in cell wall biosynthesis